MFQQDKEFLEWARKQIKRQDDTGEATRLVLETDTLHVLRAVVDLQRYIKRSGTTDISPLLALCDEYDRQASGLHSIADLMKKYPPESLRWTFENDRPTYLEIDDEQRAGACWVLTKESTEDISYEVTPTAHGVLSLIHHLSEKTWVDQEQMLDALMPAIRTVLHGNY